MAASLPDIPDDNCHFENTPGWYGCDGFIFVHGHLTCDTGSDDVFCLPDDDTNLARCQSGGDYQVLTNTCARQYSAHRRASPGPSPCSWLGELATANCNGTSYIYGMIRCGGLAADQIGYCEDTVENRADALKCAFLQKNVSEVNQCGEAIQRARRDHPTGGTKKTGGSESSI